MADLQAMMTPEEVAALLRSSPETIRRMCRVGLIDGVKFGKKWLIPPDEVERLLREGAPASKPVELAGGRIHPGSVIEGSHTVGDPDPDPDRSVKATGGRRFGLSEVRLIG